MLIFCYRRVRIRNKRISILGEMHKFMNLNALRDDFMTAAAKR